MTREELEMQVKVCVRSKEHVEYVMRAIDAYAEQYAAERVRKATEVTPEICTEIGDDMAADQSFLAVEWDGEFSERLTARLREREGV